MEKLMGMKSMPTKSARHALLTLAFGLFSLNIVPLQSFAESAIANMQVQATVGSACYVSVIGSIFFGDIGGRAGPVISDAANVSIKCTDTSKASVKLQDNGGLHYDSTNHTRRMIGSKKIGSNDVFVPYTLIFIINGAASITDTGSDKTVTLSSGKNVVSIMGNIETVPSTLPVASYGDTVTLRITY